MRLLLLLSVLTAAAAGSSSAYADTLPTGSYTLSAHTTTTGIHQSIDQGTLNGTIIFGASSQITSANLTFLDMTDGLSFSFTVPGLTTYTPAAHLLDAIISNASDPSIVYYFSISTQPTAGVYRLTCGTDCWTDAEIPDMTGKTKLNEELLGNLTPTAVTPEPSTLMLLGTGILGTVGAIRRRV